MSKPESNLQSKCIKYLKAQNIYYVNVFGGGRSAKGCPDLLTCINGRFVAFELKVGSNKPKDDQLIHKLRIEKSNGLHFVPYTFIEFKDIVDRLMDQ